MTTITLTVPDWFLWTITIALVISIGISIVDLYLRIKLRRITSKWHD